MSDKNKSIVSQSAEKFSEHYEENPLTALLLTTFSLVVPQIAIGKEAIDRAVTKIQKERFETLLDELAKGEKLLTPEIIESEEFIHSFVVVYRAAINTYQRNKIRRFARIQLKAIEEDELASNKFEEFVNILENLTEREVALLSLLSNLEKQYCTENENDLKSEDKTIRQHYGTWITEVTIFVWDEFLKSAHQTYDIDETTLISMLYRLRGMGLYAGEALVEKERVYEVGTTSNLFELFAEWIKLEAES